MGESNVYREVALEEDSISVQEQKNLIVPQKICFPWYVKLSRCIIDILTLLLSIAFLVYASLIIRLNDTSTENPEAKRRLLSAAKAVSPQLFKNCSFTDGQIGAYNFPTTVCGSCRPDIALLYILAATEGREVVPP